MDVRIADAGGTWEDKLAAQAEIYRDMLEVCLYEEACTAFVMWGFTDKYSWIYEWFGPTYPEEAPLILHPDYSPKPAYWAIWNALAEGLCTEELIEPTGGILSVPFGYASIILPGGAVTGTVLARYCVELIPPTLSGSSFGGVDRFLSVSAVYSSTERPAQLTPGFSYTSVITYETIGPVDETTLALYYWDEAISDWSQSGITSSLNITDNVVVAQVDHFSEFAVLGVTHRVYLPLAVRAH